MEISTNYAATSACRSLAGGDLKPWRSLLGNELHVMVLSVVCSYGTLALARIQWCHQLVAGWPDTLTASSFAAAGVRTLTETMLRGVSGRAGGVCGFLGAQ